MLVQWIGDVVISALFGVFNNKRIYGKDCANKMYYFESSISEASDIIPIIPIIDPPSDRTGTAMVTNASDW